MEMLVTAKLKEPLCVFLVGMQGRSWRSAWKLPFIGRRMMKMQSELLANPGSGFLWGQNFSSRNPMTTLFLSYWKSKQDIFHFVSSNEYSHMQSVGEYYSRFKKDPNIGIWHETYEIQPGHTESLYHHMAPFGLSAILPVSKVEMLSHQFIHRMNSKLRSKYGQ